MPFFRLQKSIAYSLIVLCSCSVFAADVTAILHSHGATLLNGTGSPHSSAIFTGDEMRTTRNSFANITAPGSSVVVMANSAVKFEGSAVNLTRGGVVVSTSQGMATRARNLTIEPVSRQPSKFEVRDSNGSVLIAAYKGTLMIRDNKAMSLLREGQQTKRNYRDSEKAGDPANSGGQEGQGGATPAASGAPGVGGPSGGTIISVMAVGGVASAIATAAVVTSKTSSNSCPISVSNPATPGCD